MTPLKHKKKWRSCLRCSLSKSRLNTCLFRSSDNALKKTDLLFVGEAPGAAEDALGLPFVGSSGDTLDEMIAEAQSPIKFTWTLTNVVACLPPGVDPVFGDAVRQPDQKEIDTCFERLEEMIDLCDNPQLIAVGKVAEEVLLDKLGKDNIAASIHHPEFIDRHSERNRSNLFYAAVNEIRKVVMEKS